MGRRILWNLCALLIGIALSLMFLEVALRIYNPVVETVKGEKVVLRPNYDEIRQNARIPAMQNTRIPGVAPVSYIHQNSLGFRGADPPTDFADWLSIITIGGSTTRSAAQSDDRTWTALIGDAVANCFDRTWINNAGFDGHTSFAHIDLIRNHVKKLHPKVVLLLIGANELFVDGGPDQEQVVLERTNLYGGIKGLLITLASQSESVDLGLTLYRSFRAWRGGLNWANMAEGEAMPSGGEARLAVAKDLQPEYAERLRRMIRLLRDGQTIPVLITQPTVGGIGRDPTTGKDLSRLWWGLFWSQTFEMYNDTMRSVARSENVYLIDLARFMPKNTKYYWDPMHYTDAGSDKVAQVVTTRLLPYLGQNFPPFNKGNCEILSSNPD
jgi:GDSL-like lipase/acylhydrolase family protein